MSEDKSSPHASADREDHLAHVVNLRKDCMAGRAVHYGGAKQVDRAEPGLTPKATKPRGVTGHKGDG